MPQKDNSMFTFVKSQFEPDMGFNRNRNNSNSTSSIHSNYNNNFHPIQPIPIIMSNNNTPIPMIHDQLTPHNEDQFNTKKIHQIPKPPPRSTPRSVQPPPPPRKGSNSVS